MCSCQKCRDYLLCAIVDFGTRVSKQIRCGKQKTGSSVSKLTSVVPMGWMGHPKEIAETVVFYVLMLLDTSLDSPSL